MQAALQGRRVAAAAAAAPAAAGSRVGAVEAVGGGAGGDSGVEGGCRGGGDRRGNVVVGFGIECVVGRHGDVGHCSRRFALLLPTDPGQLSTRSVTCWNQKQES